MIKETTEIVFEFSELEKNWVMTAARYGSILPLGCGRERFIVNTCSKKGIRSMYRGITKAAALQEMLEKEGLLYRRLKVMAPYHLSDHGRDRLDSLEDLFGGVIDET